MSKCCMCGCDIEYGNNPEPLALSEDERCCDDCNFAVVIPARLYELKKRRLTIDEIKTIRASRRK